MWERGKGEKGKEKCAEAARQLLPRVFLKLGNFHKSRKAFLRKLNLMKKNSKCLPHISMSLYPGGKLE